MKVAGLLALCFCSLGHTKKPVLCALYCDFIINFVYPGKTKMFCFTKKKNDCKLCVFVTAITLSYLS